MTNQHALAHSTRRRSRVPVPLRRLPLRSGLAALLLATGLLMATASPAAAHDQIISSSPEAGATVGLVPEEISLTFSGEILADFSAVVIEVVAPDGQNIASGEPVIDGTTVTQAVRPGQAGMFTVRWRVVSSDGHPISNEYQYTVENVAIPTSTPTPEATEEPTPEPSPTSTATTSAGEVHTGPSGGGEFLPVLAVLSGVVVLGGALGGVLMAARERRRRDRAVTATQATASGDEVTGKGKPADES